jgi:hypothetical protein
MPLESSGTEEGRVRGRLTWKATRSCRSRSSVPSHSTSSCISTVALCDALARELGPDQVAEHSIVLDVNEQHSRCLDPQGGLRHLSARLRRGKPSAGRISRVNQVDARRCRMTSAMSSSGMVSATSVRMISAATRSGGPVIVELRRRSRPTLMDSPRRSTRPSV